jgi:hypothetical protein
VSAFAMHFCCGGTRTEFTDGLISFNLLISVITVVPHRQLHPYVLPFSLLSIVAVV